MQANTKYTKKNYVLYTYIIWKYINPKKYRMQSTIKSKTRSMKHTEEPSKKKNNHKSYVGMRNIKGLPG